MRCHRSLSVSFSLSLFGNACQMRQESEHLRRGSHKLFAFASLIVLLLPWLLHRHRCTRVHSQHTPHSGGDELKATVSIRGPRKESVDNLTELSGTVDFLPHLVAPSAVVVVVCQTHNFPQFGNGALHVQQIRNNNNNNSNVDQQN